MLVKKESKNLGMSKRCPWDNCKKTFIRDVNFKGEGDGYQRCAHCKQLVHISFFMQQKMNLEAVMEKDGKRIIILLLIFSAILFIGLTMKAKPEFVEKPYETQ